MVMNKISADALQNKSTLAKLLASENITVQHNPSARTASFHLESRILTLPVFRDGMSPELVDMLIIHEVGHALNTPMAGWVGAIDSISEKHKAKRANIRGFLNVVEDPRNDKLMKRKFPGARRDYVMGYKELHKGDFFKVRNRDINKMGFIDRANLYFKGGGMMNIKFTEQEQRYIDQIASTESFEDVVEVTEAIFLYAREQKQEENSHDDGQEYGPEGEAGEYEESEDDEDSEGEESEGVAQDDSEGDDSEGEESDEAGSEGDDSDDDSEEPGSEGDDSDDGDDEDDSDDDDSDDGDSDDGDSDDDDSDDDDSDDDSDSDDSDQGHGGDVNDSSDEEDDPESETDKAWEDSQDSLYKNSDLVYKYITVPDFNLNNIIDDYKVVLKEKTESKVHALLAMKNSWSRQYYTDNAIAQRQAEVDGLGAELKEFLLKEKSSVSYMVKEFEMKKAASAYARESVSKTGVLDTNKLHSYRFNDDIFKRNLSVPTGKNHGFVMFLDWSGSMGTNLRKTVQQLINITMFCRQVSIPFEVYTFRSATAPQDTKYFEASGSWRGTQRTTIMRERQMSDKDSDIMFDTVKLRNILSSRMTSSEYNTSLGHLWFQSNRKYEYSLKCDPLTSTPLDQTILAASGVIDLFKKRSGVEITNVVFLTDGDSDSMSGTYGDGRQRYDPGSKSYYVLQDNQTKKSYDLGRSLYGNTNLFLRILKSRTTINLIGFFIAGGRFAQVIHRSGLLDQVPYGPERSELARVAKDSWKNDKYMSGTSNGYDEYYILDSEGMNLGTEVMNITPNMPKAKQLKEFKRVSRSTTSKRQMLKSFIGHVCS
jgi:hypothetical protein